MKTPTQWRPRDSGTTSATSGSILTQDSEELITQAGDTLVVTETLVSGPMATSWNNSTKITTAWKPRDSGTTTTDNDGVERTTEAGDTRVTQDGVTRVLNESVVEGKTPTSWTDND